MKYMFLFLGGLSLAAAGCRSADHHRDSSSTAPDLKRGNVAFGELVIEPLKGPPMPKEAPPVLYTVHDESGKLIARSSTTNTQLSAGRYRIHIEKAGLDIHEFWVTIEPGRTTRVDLTKIEEGEPATTVD